MTRSKYSFIFNILFALISAFIFCLSGIFTGLSGIVGLFLTSAIYAVIQYFCIKSDYLLDLLEKFTLTAIFGFTFMWFIYKNEVFYKIFVSVYQEKPSAGDGFGLFVSMMFNVVIFLIISIISALSIKTEKNRQ